VVKGLVVARGDPLPSTAGTHPGAGEFEELTARAENKGRFDARRRIVVESPTAIKCLTEKAL